MTTNVEPPRPGAVGGAAAGGTAPGTTTTTPGVSKKEPIGKRGKGDVRIHPLASFENSQSRGKVGVIGDSRKLHFTRSGESCEFIHQSLGLLRGMTALLTPRHRGNNSMSESLARSLSGFSEERVLAWGVKACFVT